MKLFTAPEGLRGFDCNSSVTPRQAELMKQADYHFALRYVRRDQKHIYDLTKSECKVLANADLGIMAVQHVESESSWVPSLAKGKAFGLTAAQEMLSLDLPPGTICWCDLEGVNSAIPSLHVSSYLNAWYDEVRKENFEMGIYAGWRTGLSASDLYQKTKCRRFWGAYNQNKDEAPPVRGNQLKQRLSRPEDRPKTNISLGFNVDTVLRDKFGSLPLVAANEGWDERH